MSKPEKPLPPEQSGFSPKEVLEAIIKNKEELNQLYETRNILIKKFLLNFGTETIFKKNSDGTYTKVRIIDNAKRLEDGFYEFVRVGRYYAEIKTLKNKPKELRDV